jgi:hypothetical protein
MKRLGAASLSLLVLMALAAPRGATAQSAASGTYRFMLEDGLVKALDFDAKTDERGSTTGTMSFYDPARIPDVDDPEDPKAGDTPPEFSIKASLDTMVVEKNRALLSGTIVSSTHRTYLGQWVQLVVEDNAGNPEATDRLTWTFCHQPPGGWIPSDAERDRDDGAFLSWWATDAERKDDVGIPSPNLIPGEQKFCRVYPLSLYTFADVLKWDGDIIVQP